MIGGFGHEVHAAEHDVVGVRAFGGVLGQLEGVAHEIGVLDDLVTLVEVAQNQQFGAETLLGVGDALLQFPRRRPLRYSSGNTCWRGALAEPRRSSIEAPDRSWVWWCRSAMVLGRSCITQVLCAPSLAMISSTDGAVNRMRS